MILRPCLLKFAFSLVVLTLLITNQSLSQPIKTPPFKNIIVHPKPKNIISEEYKDQNGKKIKFIKFEKQVTIINFWATWCAPCREEMPSIDKLVDILGKEKISV
ncbi:MAG: TlpA disulfide reductase family protein, partial [Candidatus Fonsibacter sp.]